MTAEEAIKALKEMEDNRTNRRMLAVVKATGKVPLWIENEIKFEKVATPVLSGNRSGNDALREDQAYHGGYTE